MGWIIFILLWLLAEFYGFLVVRSAVRKFPRNLRITLIALYLLVSIFLELGMFFFRHVEWTDYAIGLRTFYIAMAFGMFIGKILVLAIMLLEDVRRGLVWIYNRLVPKKEEIDETKGSLVPRSVFIMRTSLVLAGLSLSGFLYGTRNRYKYHIRRIRISSRKIPQSFKGLRIVQISDVHTGSFDDHEAVAAGIQKILDLKPDVIFFTGDLVNDRTDEVDDKFKEIYSRLKAPLGVYSTLGNHDYGDYHSWPSTEAKEANLEAMIKLHADLGWKLMMDEHVLLERGGESIGLIGVQNITGIIGRFHTYGDLPKAYNGIEQKNAPFKILLSHDPSHWNAEVTKDFKDIDLTLSGHTHGMQFGVEIPGFKWSPSQYWFRQWAGLYTEGEQHVYVNRGFGFLGYPGRLGILAEISLIELA